MLPATLRESARRFGDRVAYVAENGLTLTYAALDEMTDSIAAGMRARGLREGEVIALVLPPGLEYLVAYVAAAKIGAITAGVNDRLRRRERDAVLACAAPRLVVAAPGLEPAGIDHVCVPVAEHPDDLLSELRSDGETVEALPSDPERPVAIVFTSGTTGTPKGALYCERQLGFIADTDVGEAWGSGGASYAGTSFAHLGFMTKLPGNLRRGGTQFILSRWSASKCLDLVERERLVTVAGVPTQIALMLRDPRFEVRDLSSVRLLMIGGGPVTPGLAEEARERFGAQLATRYSCTEAGIGLGTGPDDPPEDAIVSVGRPHPAVELGVLDEHDQPVADGEVGEVCLRSPAVMSGYWRDDAATRDAFTADGFVRTGDLGWVDDAGRLRLVGRSKEMYVRGGYNVYPAEVEAVLSEHPALAAIALVPKADPVMGEVGVAVAVARDALAPPTLADLRDFAADRLAHHKLPEGLLVVDELPLTAMEKLDRRALYEQVAAAETT